MYLFLHDPLICHASLESISRLGMCERYTIDYLSVNNHHVYGNLHQLNHQNTYTISFENQHFHPIAQPIILLWKVISRATCLLNALTTLFWTPALCFRLKLNFWRNVIHLAIRSILICLWPFRDLRVSWFEYKIISINPIMLPNFQSPCHIIEFFIIGSPLQMSFI